jgi:hypothetical protein
MGTDCSMTGPQPLPAPSAISLRGRGGVVVAGPTARIVSLSYPHSSPISALGFIEDRGAERLSRRGCRWSRLSARRRGETDTPLREGV